MSRRRARMKTEKDSDSEAEKDVAWLRDCVREVWLEPESDEVVRALAASSSEFVPSERVEASVEEEMASAARAAPARAPVDEIGKRLLLLPESDPSRVFVESIRKQIQDKCDELEREMTSASRGKEFAATFDRSMAKAISKKHRALSRALLVVQTNVDTIFNRMCISFIDLKTKISVFESDPSLSGHTKGAIVESANSKLAVKREEMISFSNELFSFSNECIQSAT
jgi:hypothetical protein